MTLATVFSESRAAGGLSLAGVAHAYGRNLVLDAVELAVGPGEIVCLLGPSGCGKTTLVRLAAGLEVLQQGTISVAGCVVSSPSETVPPEGRRVGLMFQDFALFPHLTVVDNVAFGLRDLPAATRRQTAVTLLERVGLAGLASAYPHVLSGGEQQRVALVRALAPRPQVMLLDEPFSGLDARLRDQVRDQTLSILKEQGVATLLVTHDAEEALFMADRVALMAEGRLVQVGSAEDLYFQPASSFVAGFFSELNRLEGVSAGGAVETPLGSMPCHGVPDGRSVVVLARLDGFRLVDPPRGVPARIEAVRFLGPVSLVQARFAQGAVIRARLRPDRGLNIGETVCLGLDPRYAFVFPS